MIEKALEMRFVAMMSHLYVAANRRLTTVSRQGIHQAAVLLHPRKRLLGTDTARASLHSGSA